MKTLFDIIGRFSCTAYDLHVRLPILINGDIKSLNKFIRVEAIDTKLIILQLRPQ